MDNQYRIKLLSCALRDLDGIYAYIARTLSEPGTADRLLDMLEQEILSLESMPYRCAERKVGAYAGMGYRHSVWMRLAKAALRGCFRCLTKSARNDLRLTL